MDFAVVSFVTKYQYHRAEKLMSKDERIELIESAIMENSDIEMIYLK